MKKLFLFEIEADEKPILNVGDWEKDQYLTADMNFAEHPKNVVAYGEVENGRYIELYDRVVKSE